ncbi:hypothetical protein SapgrDRAFT_1473 [Saprospira grandis DSM 2844]|uniref:Uncharacterized protein n=1 Tax=Saprospira grandis DSM 2844 TaxID=694433 RepID=J0P096_9BACT|nr:hypothetical protein [Saprospira grandis]EJF53189.1 hypothetical protein SapgrDRAFT_1473 [Saprospira grandis DSM 2844]
MAIQTVSSRWTFLSKIILPFLWSILFGGFTLVVWLSPLQDIQAPLSPLSAKLILSSFFISMLGLFYLFFMRNLWVGLDDEHIYASNYFKSVKYSYGSLEHFEESNLFLFSRITLHFKEKGQFGKSISFIRSHYWKYYLEKHPDLLQFLLQLNEAKAKK